MFGLFALAGFLIVASYAAIATILLRKFLHTRNIGFVLLGSATVIWPLVHLLVQHWESKIVVRMAVSGFPEFFAGISIGSLLELLEALARLLGVVLLLAAVWYLYRPVTEQNDSTPLSR